MHKNIHLSGRLNLTGRYISLACFHGPNFRSQNWALFTLRDPTLSFTTETNVYEKSCQVMRATSVHNAMIVLGKEDKKQNEGAIGMRSNMDFNVDGRTYTYFKIFLG